MLSRHILHLCGDRSSSSRPGYPGTLPAPADMLAHQGGGVPPKTESKIGVADEGV